MAVLLAPPEAPAPALPPAAAGVVPGQQPGKPRHQRAAPGASLPPKSAMLEIVEQAGTQKGKYYFREASLLQNALSLHSGHHFICV